MFNHEPDGYVCPLCIFAKGGGTELNKREDIVFQNETVSAFISPKWWIHNPGNVMIIPKVHIENIYDIPDDLLAEIQILGKKIASGLKETYKCDGVSFRQHNEPAGGQDVWHFHLHVFPRWSDDNLYVNHEQSRYVSTEERAPYAQKLRDYLGK